MTFKPTQLNITSQNWVYEFKKLIKKLAGSKSRKIKKLAAWLKKIEFLINKKTAYVSYRLHTACILHNQECVGIRGRCYERSLLRNIASPDVATKFRQGHISRACSCYCTLISSVSRFLNCLQFVYF